MSGEPAACSPHVHGDCARQAFANPWQDLRAADQLHTRRHDCQGPCAHALGTRAEACPVHAQTLTKALLRRVDDQIKREVIAWAAFYVRLAQRVANGHVD